MITNQIFGYHMSDKQQKRCTIFNPIRVIQLERFSEKPRHEKIRCSVIGPKAWPFNVKIKLSLQSVRNCVSLSYAQLACGL